MSADALLKESCDDPTVLVGTFIDDISVLSILLFFV